MRLGSKRTPEMRAAMSAKMRVIMNDPAVRHRVSEGTKAGMRAAAEELPELMLLRTAWASSRPSVRKRFIDELFSAAYASAPPAS